MSFYSPRESNRIFLWIRVCESYFFHFTACHRAIAPAEIFSHHVAPTSVPMVGSYRSFGQAALKLTHSFHWRHISILLDTSIVYTDFYRQLASEIMQAGILANTSTLETFNFDGSDPASILISLQNAQKRSRGTVNARVQFQCTFWRSAV